MSWHSVLCVTNDFPPAIGGIQTYVYDYCLGLAAAGIAVHVLASIPRDRTLAAAAAQWDRAQPFTVHRHHLAPLLPTPAVGWTMRRLIRAYGIDTVWFGAAAPLGLLAEQAREAGASQIIASTHGHEVGWLTVPRAGALISRITQSCDVVTYISEFTRQRLEPLVGTASLVHLPGAVTVPDSEPARLDHEELWVTCVSRLVRRKGQDWLIRAVSELDGVQLNLVGEGPDERYLRRLARRTGAHVTWWGHCSDESVDSILSSSDIFAMPARTRWGGIDVEGLGIVYLQAQAWGLPVIAGSSGGAPETVAPQSGIVVATYPELVAALQALVADPERRQAMGRAGREHVAEHWDRERLRARFVATVGGTQ
ncbi:MAG: glycosyltransferase family 4 protein [Corynebacterium sp.]|nr:glycosyltransferase family 4 protein [Corynebacterium sp.]